jgi:hypothetical protein
MCLIFSTAVFRTFLRQITIQRVTPEMLTKTLVSFHVKCPLLLSAFIESRSMSTNLINL